MIIMKLIMPVFAIIVLFFIPNSSELNVVKQKDNYYSITISNKALGEGILYFSSPELFNGEKFTINEFKMKVPGSPSITVKDIAFKKNYLWKHLNAILKENKKAHFYDIKSFMYKNGKTISPPKYRAIKLLLED